MASAEASNEAIEKLREAGKAYFAGLGQFGSKDGAAATPFAHIAQWWAKVPAIGIARESVALVRAVTEAQAECERVGGELHQVFMNVQREALDLLERRASERVHAAKPLASYREVCDLWVECGEEIYAQVARSESFSTLQAKFGNAAMRLRAAEQRLAEQALRRLDLPTRAELNSVHRRLQEMRTELERLRAGAAPAKPSARKAAPKRAKATRRAPRKSK
jgi:class III poly(R)-hydroxyalkanoic acid synthase PhaE subunit